MVDCPMCGSKDAIDNAKVSVGMRVRAMRGEAPQVEYATSIGLTKAQLANVESDLSAPSGSVLILLASKHRVSRDYILNGPVPTEPAPETKDAAKAK